MVKNPPANAGGIVQCLVQEDATCLRATKAHVPQLLKPVDLEPLLRSTAPKERPPQ